MSHFQNSGNGMNLGEDDMSAADVLASLSQLAGGSSSGGGGGMGGMRGSPLRAEQQLSAPHSSNRFDRTDYTMNSGGSSSGGGGGGGLFGASFHNNFAPTSFIPGGYAGHGGQGGAFPSYQMNRSLQNADFGGVGPYMHNQHVSLGTVISNYSQPQNRRKASSLSNNIFAATLKDNQKSMQRVSMNGEVPPFGARISNSSAVAPTLKSDSMSVTSGEANSNSSVVSSNDASSSGQFRSNLRPQSTQMHKDTSPVVSPMVEMSASYYSVPSSSPIPIPMAMAMAMHDQQRMSSDWDDSEDDRLYSTEFSGSDSMSGRTDDEDFTPTISDASFNMNSRISTSAGDFNGSSNSNSNNNNNNNNNEITRRKNKKLEIKGLQETPQGYRIQLTARSASTKKITKNLDRYHEALMYYEIALLLTDKITHLSVLLARGNFNCLRQMGLMVDAREFYVVLGRYIFLFEKLKKIKTDLDMFLDAYENLIIDVDFPTNPYGNRVGGGDADSMLLSQTSALNSSFAHGPSPFPFALPTSTLQHPPSMFSFATGHGQFQQHHLPTGSFMSQQQQQQQQQQLMSISATSQGLPSSASVPSIMRERFPAKMYEVPMTFVFPAKGLSFNSNSMNAKAFFDDLSVAYMTSYKVSFI